MLPVSQNQELFYRIALTFVNGIGTKFAKSLLGHFGSAEAIFKASLKDLRHIDGLGEVRVKGFKDEGVFTKAEEELAFIEKHSVRALWMDDDDYPQRLKNCVDAPVLLYSKGNANFNTDKIVAVIGSRKNTDYGSRVTEELLKGLAGQENLLVTSGLAHGIDALAHKYSVANNIETVGVLGHGLDRVYPSSNRQLAADMIQQGGGLLSEFPSGTIPDRENFPMRNRVVAGMSDITIVIESDIKGGAMITARIADSYNRQVAAFPGRIFDARSAGCNELVRANIASMITSADDVLELMNWNKTTKKPVQRQLFIHLTDDEQKIINALQQKDSLHADELMYQTGISNSQLAAVLLQLEMQDLIKTLPGKHYRMN